LAKHKNNLLQIEALLFGQAGFLEENQDPYPKQLQKEYQYLKQKFSLRPIDKHTWKFARLRPANFPTIRIAEFAGLIFQSSKLFSKILETENPKDIEKLFKANASEYWLTHYRFGKPSKKRIKTFSKDAIDLLIINTIVPFLFVYGQMKDDQQYKDKALKLLSSIRAEKNSIIKKWADLNIKAKSAADSQSLLQLKNEYCNNKNCHNCAIGHQILNFKL